MFYTQLFSQDELESELKKLKIKGVNFTFEGTSSFDVDELSSLISTPKNEYFNPENFASDILRIEKFYFDNGFIDAFVDTTTDINIDDKTIIATFIIKENSPYLINKINYFGLEDIPPDLIDLFLNKEIRFIYQNERYSKKMVSMELSRITTLLQNNGYANAYSDQPEIVKIESNNPFYKNKLNVNFYITPGKRYLFGRTRIQISNNKYNLNLSDILKDLEYNENDIYSKEKLIESEIRLNKISILENPRIQIDYIDSTNNKIYLKVTGNITNKYEVQPEFLGYDINNLFYAGIGLSFKDKFLWGTGRTLTSRAVALLHSDQTNILEFLLELYQPYIFSNNKINGFWKISGTVYSDEDFRISQIKNTFTINYELPKYTYLNYLVFDWKIGNDRFYIKRSIPTDSTGILIGNSTINSFSSVFGISLIHDNTNNFAFPTKGYYQSYLLEESGLLSNIVKRLFATTTFSYIKISSLNKLFIDLSRERGNSVLAFKLLTGAIFEYGDNVSKVTIGGTEYEISYNFIPFEAKFIAGGSISVRGWPARKLGTFEGSEFGGNFLLEGTVEHRSKPFIDRKSIFKDLGFVLFMDYGNLWKTPSKFSPYQINIATGLGIRYYTIIGPVRFDIAFKFYDYSPDSGTNKWLYQNSFNVIMTKKLTLQFGIGNTF